MTFVDVVTTGPVDSLGERGESEVRTDIPGCHHRPLTFDESHELGYGVTTEAWRTTIPLRWLDPALVQRVLDADDADLIEVNGNLFMIDGGVKPFTDAAGRPWKATVISKRQFG